MEQQQVTNENNQRIIADTTLPDYVREAANPSAAYIKYQLDKLNFKLSVTQVLKLIHPWVTPHNPRLTNIQLFEFIYRHSFASKVQLKHSKSKRYNCLVKNKTPTETLTPTAITNITNGVNNESNLPTIYATVSTNDSIAKHHVKSKLVYKSVKIIGECDAITTRGYIIEQKTRAKVPLFRSTTPYDRDELQCQLYMKMFNNNQCKLVETYQPTGETNVIYIINRDISQMPELDYLNDLFTIFKTHFITIMSKYMTKDPTLEQYLSIFNIPKPPHYSYNNGTHEHEWI